jgi:MFS family permease
MSRRIARRNARYVYVGALIALTGAQMIAPSLPVMRDALGLDSAQLALVMSVYLLPAAVAAIPAGVLADRVGRRLVFGGSFIGFGVCGLALPLVSGHFSVFLAVRFLQGVMFAGLLPLTMTILGDAFRGHELVRAQGGRSVAISFADGALPILGGLLVGVAWWAPWLGQSLGIPFGVAVLLRLVDPVEVRSTRRTWFDIPAFLGLFRRLPILALQYMGFLRMFLKFAILTFLPVFIVDIREQSPAFAGLVIGATALSGTAVAALSGRLARIGRSTFWIAVGVAGMGIGMASMVLLPWVWTIVGAAIFYGMADGVMGVFTNSMVTAATGFEQRASFVAATGAVRNLAKFLAPTAIGAVTLVTPLASAFVGTGAATLASVVIVRSLRPLEQGLLEDGET